MAMSKEGKELGKKELDKIFLYLDKAQDLMSTYSNAFDVDEICRITNRVKSLIEKPKPRVTKKCVEEWAKELHDKRWPETKCSKENCSAIQQYFEAGLKLLQEANFEIEDK